MCPRGEGGRALLPLVDYQGRIRQKEVPSVPFAGCKYKKVQALHDLEYTKEKRKVGFKYLKGPFKVF